MIEIVLGLILGLLIGGACRWFDIPVPAPPTLAGALLVVAMTLGFVVADTVMSTTSNSLPQSSIHISISELHREVHTPYS